MFGTFNHTINNIPEQVTARNVERKEERGGRRNEK
jgi:hypothetical protein